MDSSGRILKIVVSNEVKLKYLKENGLTVFVVHAKVATKLDSFALGVT